MSREKNILQPCKPAPYHTYKTTPEAIKQAVEYSFSVAHSYLQQIKNSGLSSIEGKRVLEIGPGENFGAAFILKSLGSATVHLADKFLSEYNQEYHNSVYTAIRAQIKKHFPEASTDIFDLCIEASTHVVNGVYYHKQGLENLDEMPDNNIDIIFSNAVLEHLASPQEAFQELFRVTDHGGIGLHQVDFRDHRDFTRPLEFLLSDDSKRYSVATKDNFVFGNAWRPKEYTELYKCVGFTVEAEILNLFAEPGYLRTFMPRLRVCPSKYRNWAEKDLSILSSLVLLKKY